LPLIISFREVRGCGKLAKAPPDVVASKPAVFEDKQLAVAESN